MKQIEFQDLNYKGLVPTKSFVEASRLIKRVVNNNSIGAIYGQPGMGKSTVRKISMGRYQESDKYKVIHIDNVKNKSDLTGDLMSFMVDQLIDEKPSRNPIKLTSQFKNALQIASKSKHIILSIDEAQDLKPASFYGLKKMHEIGSRFHGGSLFSIILFGKPELRAKISEYELSFRMQTFQMKPMQSEEVKEYLRVQDFKFKSDRLYDAFFRECNGLPLAAHKIILNVQEIAKEKKLDNDRAFSYYLTGNLNQQVKDVGISLTGISKQMFRIHKKHVDTSTINRANRGETNTKLSEEIREVTANMIKEKQNEN